MGKRWSLHYKACQQITHHILRCLQHYIFQILTFASILFVLKILYYPSMAYFATLYKLPDLFFIKTFLNLLSINCCLLLGSLNEGG
jgi:hypothetical protein